MNDSKPGFILEKIRQAVEQTDKEISNLTIACLGLAYKPDIDDLRESPALGIAHKVELMGVGKLLLVEPNITEIPEGFDDSRTKLVTLDKAIRSAEVVVLLVDHLQFKETDLGLLSGKQVVDTRGSWTAL